MSTEAPKLTLSQRKRLDILAASREEFLETGFRDTSMDRVAERAQVSKRTVYNHFPSKEDLFKAVAIQFIENLQQAISLEYDPGRAADEQLRELARREIQQITDPDYVAVFRLFLAEITNFPDLFNEILEESGTGHDPVQAWVSAAMKDGALKKSDAQLAASQFTALLKGPLFWPAVAGYGDIPSPRECKTVMEGAVSMFMDHHGSRR